MRYLLITSACVMAVMVAVSFMGEPSTARAFEDRRIVVIAGGRPSDTFSESIRLGEAWAEADLGCDVDVFSPDWDMTQEVALFQQEMAGAPDGICVIGNPANEALLPHIEDAIEAEISVTTFYRPLPEMEAAYRAMGFGFAGPDFRALGFELLEKAAVKHKLTPGGRVLIVTDPATMELDELWAGSLDAIRKYGLIEEFLEIDIKDTDSVLQKVQRYLAEARDKDALPALIGVLRGPLEHVLAGVIGAGLEPGEVPFVGLGSLERSNSESLQRNRAYISLMLSEDLATQVYMAVLQICMTKAYGASGSHVSTPHRILDLGDAAANPAGVSLQPFVQID